jgi:hypothetical protein
MIVSFLLGRFGIADISKTLNKKLLKASLIAPYFVPQLT